MFQRLLIASAAVLALGTSPLVSAQPASAPAAAKPAAAAPASTAAAGEVSEGKLAYYGSKFAGRKTANGERFNPGAMTMAHKTLPFGTMVRVTNPANKRSVVLRVNDRGPSTPDRVGDVSVAAAKRLGFMRAGVIDAKLEVVGQRGGKRKG
jgi:rare lipoprotein A